MASGRKQVSPSFSFYPQDFLASAKVQRMSPAERGDYITLLCRCFLEGGWISTETEDLAEALGCDDDEVESRMTKRLRRCFIEKDGMIGNERLLREIDLQSENRKARQEAGAKGGKKGRNPKSDNNADEDADESGDAKQTEAPLKQTEAPLKQTEAPLKQTEAPLKQNEAVLTPSQANESIAQAMLSSRADAFHSVPVPSSPVLSDPLRSAEGESEGEGSSVPSSPDAAPEPASQKPKGRKPRKPPRRRWRIVDRDGVPDIEGVDDRDRADDAELGPDVDADQLRRKQAAWCVARLGEGQKVPKDLRRSFYKLAQPHLNDGGGWLVREQASAAAGRSPFAKGEPVTDQARQCDPLAQDRIDMPTHGSWPINRRGFDPERDGGELFSLERAAQVGEFFYVSIDGLIRPSAANGGATEPLRRATLEEIFGWFAEPGRDPDVAEKWGCELRMAGERGHDLAGRFRSRRRSVQTRELNRSMRGGDASSIADVLQLRRPNSPPGEREAAKVAIGDAGPASETHAPNEAPHRASQALGGRTA